MQAGWYVGWGNDNLPCTTVPTIFVGEQHDCANGTHDCEVLRTGFGAFNWSTSHTFKITQVDTPYGTYDNIYVNGQFVTNTLYPHPYAGDAAFTGEVDYQNIKMYANAREDSSPWATLQWLGTGGNWNNFNDDRYTTFYPYYTSTGPKGQATDVASGDGLACT